MSWGRFGDWGGGRSAGAGKSASQGNNYLDGGVSGGGFESWYSSKLSSHFGGRGGRKSWDEKNDNGSGSGGSGSGGSGSGASGGGRGQGRWGKKKCEQDRNKDNEKESDKNTDPVITTVDKGAPVYGGSGGSGSGGSGSSGSGSGGSGSGGSGSGGSGSGGSGSGGSGSGGSGSGGSGSGGSGSGGSGSGGSGSGGSGSGGSGSGGSGSGGSGSGGSGSGGSGSGGSGSGGSGSGGSGSGGSGSGGSGGDPKPPVDPEPDKTTLSFEVGGNGDPSVTVQVTQTPEGQLFINLQPTSYDGEVADIDGLFFNMSDDADVPGLNFFPDENALPITGHAAEANSVNTLDDGTSAGQDFDGMVQFGQTPDSTDGTVNSANFTLWSDSGLTLDDIDLSSLSLVVTNPDGSQEVLEGGYDPAAAASDSSSYVNGGVSDNGLGTWYDAMTGDSEEPQTAEDGSPGTEDILALMNQPVDDQEGLSDGQEDDEMEAYL